MLQTTLNIDVPKAVSRLIDQNQLITSVEATNSIIFNIRNAGVVVTDGDEVYIGVKVREFFSKEGNPVLEKEETYYEQLRKMLFDKFGSEWTKPIGPLTIRADQPSWFFFLIEKGIEKRKEELKAEVKDKTCGVAEAAASLGSWNYDLELLLTQVKNLLYPPPKPDRKTK